MPSLRDLRRRFEQALESAEDVELGVSHLLEVDSRLGEGDTCFPDFGEDFHSLEPLGAGGMGEVYVARQRSAHDRLVALKRVPLEDQSELTLARLDAEAAAIAHLDHPNICKLYGTGRTSSGALFTILEFVDGLPIVEYCLNQRLPINQRLQLFCTLLLALQHCHARLLLHLDVKSANVLVTAEGVPKLLDFGIAHRLADHQSTMPQALSWLTAAPEQIHGLSKSVATDIFQAGTLLFQLMSGHSLFHFKPSASDKRSRSPGLNQLYRNDATFRTFTSRTVANDLSAIVSKCTANDSDDRYRSVNALLADVESVMERKPISLRRDQIHYRFQRFLSRHPWSSSSVVLFFTVIGFLLVTLSIQNSDLQKARLRAESALQESLALEDILSTALESVDPLQTADNLSARDVLAQARASLLSRSRPLPSVYEKLAQIHLNVGLIDEAGALLDAIDKGDASFNRIVLLAQIARLSGEITKADQLIQAVTPQNIDQTVNALREKSRIAAEQGDRNRATLMLADALMLKPSALLHLELARALKNNGQFDAALKELEAAKEWEATSAQFRSSVASSIELERSKLLRRKGKLASSIQAARVGLSIRESLYDNNSIAIASARNTLASALIKDGQLDEATTHLREALSSFEQHLGSTSPRYLMAAYNLANLHFREANYSDASNLIGNAIESAKSIWPEEHANLGFFFLLHSAAEIRLGQLSQAEELLDRASTILSVDESKLPSSISSAYVIAEREMLKHYQNQHDHHHERLARALEIISNENAGDADQYRAHLLSQH